MKIIKTQLMTAAAVAGLVGATGAQAATPNVYPAASLHGNGASSVAVVLPKTLNCLGGTNNPLGINNNTVQAVPDHNYVPVSPTTGNPAYNCATQSIQSNLEGEYVSTGSGAGVNNMINYVATNAGGATNNPFMSGLVDTETWNNVHFAFSENPLTSANLTTFNAVEDGVDGILGNADDVGLKGLIQIPAVVTPIAIAYAPVYGKHKTATGIDLLALNLKFPRADGTGGLRLKKTTYCGIMNGTITNWNDAALKADNGGQSLMSPLDNATRWSTTGVPIVLVGRSDSSGGTTLFTRHMAAVCGGDFGTTGGVSTLPASRRDGAAVYDANTGALLSGTVTAGEFGISAGSSGVANAVNMTIADPAAVGDYTFGGRMAYLGADWVKPALTDPAYTIHSADLQEGTGTAFKAPTAANATLSFKGILPPESASTGKYLPTAGCNSTTAGCRANPLSWVQTTAATESLANPLKGYPIVGTTNIITYMCYVTPAVRSTLSAFLALNYGKLTKDSAGLPVPAKLATSTAKDAAGLPLGIFARNGLAPLPGQWVTAINETFLTKTTSGSNPSALNLWLQNKLPVKTADHAGLLSNPGCTAGKGAAS